MSQILSIDAIEVLDSRGRPTVEAVVRTTDGSFGRAIVPSGASTGRFESVELRDRDDWYDGWGVRRAVENVRTRISGALAGLDVTEQAAIDRRMLELDGSQDKRNLGANAILGVSLAALHASAQSQRIPVWRRVHELLQSTYPQSAATPRMPRPMVNMISGGLHAGGNLDIQDVLLLPPRQWSYRDQLELIVRAYWRLGRQLTADGLNGRLVGDEGGYGPALESNEQAIACVVKAASDSGAEGFGIALDVAATHFYNEERYQLAAETRTLDASGMIDELASWCERFPIESIEDGLAEEDWAGWIELNRRLGERVRLVGDDLFTTNCQRIQRGVDCRAANAVLIKLNQIGSVTETLDAIALCRRHKLHFVVSARSGETEDDTIADLAVGVAAPEIKIGAVARSERLAKYNRLLRIERELDESAAG